MFRNPSALSVDRRRGTLAPMLVGIALFGVAPTIVFETFDLGSPFGGGRPLSIVAAGVALSGALLGRRTAWLAGLLVALGASVAGVAFQSATLVAVATPWGDELLPKNLAWQFPQGYGRILKSQEADLALLHKGAQAASQRWLLPAPEGGYLVPVSLGARGPNPYDSPLRYESSGNPNVASAWRDALRRQRTIVDDARARATMPMTNSPSAWWRQGLPIAAAALGLAIVANLAALLSRALFGEPR